MHQSVKLPPSVGCNMTDMTLEIFTGADDLLATGTEHPSLA